MGQVDRTGTFKCAPTEWGVATTRNEFPVFNVRATLTEYYDEQENEWVDWAGYEQEVVCFLCLFGYKKGTDKLVSTANHQQVMKVFDWDGESFANLANGDYSDLIFQVRIKDNDPEYADNNPFIVSWIDAHDADPVSQLNKLDVKGLKDLDNQYAMLLKKTGEGKKAVSAKTPLKTSPKVTKEPIDTEEEKKQKLLEKSRKNLAVNKENVKSTPPTRKPVSKSPKENATNESPEGSCTKKEAWETIVELKTDETTDKHLGEVWNAAIDKVAGEGIDNKDVTDAQWFEIREIVLDQVAKF